MDATLQAADALVLRGRTAADLMTHSPLSLDESATLRDALGLLVDRHVSGAAVIDEAGRPVGVLSRSDILIHEREAADSPAPPADRYATPIRELMTPAVFCVRADVPVVKVIEQMRELNVHRLFVIDGGGVLVGVVTAMDVLRNLEAAGE